MTHRTRKETSVTESLLDTLSSGSEDERIHDEVADMSESEVDAFLEGSCIDVEKPFDVIIEGTNIDNIYVSSNNKIEREIGELLIESKYIEKYGKSPIGEIDDDLSEDERACAADLAIKALYISMIIHAKGHRKSDKVHDRKTNILSAIKIRLREKWSEWNKSATQDISHGEGYSNEIDDYYLTYRDEYSVSHRKVPVLEFSKNFRDKDKRISYHTKGLGSEFDVEMINYGKSIVVEEKEIMMMNLLQMAGEYENNNMPWESFCFYKLALDISMSQGKKEVIKQIQNRMEYLAKRYNIRLSSF